MRSPRAKWPSLLLLLLLAAAAAAGESSAEETPDEKLQEASGVGETGGRKHQALKLPPAPHLVKLSNTSLSISTGVSLSTSAGLSAGASLKPPVPHPHPRPNLPALRTHPGEQQQQQLRRQRLRDQSRAGNKNLLDKICVGTTHRLAEQHNRTEHYLKLVERYKDCTYVIGNLELTWLDPQPSGEQLDLSFLESIKEVTGYLLVAHVNLERVRIPNLQIIRGRDLFRLHDGHAGDRSEEFGLILVENSELRALELPNLREILAGSFGSYYNSHLCHLLTIHSDKILNAPYKKLFVFNGTQPDCPSPCDDSCQVGCWAEGPDNCQKSSRQNCAASCPSGRCFGPLQSECCHPFCAGGCTGPRQTDCLACKSFYDDGECVQECPSLQRYNPSKFLWEPNPNGKYAFGATCVRECPKHLLRDNGACVRTCPANKRSLNGECVPCGGPCPKNCQGVEVVHSGNIDQLVNCTIVEGSLTILDSSFSGRVGDSAAQRHKPMHPSRLEVFKTLREITGYLNVQAAHPDFRNLSCFRNLRVIGGRQTTDMFHGLSITRSSLVALSLRSLRQVRSGRVTVEDNRELCFADSIDWSQINITRREDIAARNNAEPARCRQLGLVCHEQCAQDGCWGPGPDECLSCNNYKLDDFCVDNCASSARALGVLSFESGARTCQRCHAECRAGCNGTEAVHCRECRSVKDGPYCVAECPSHKYNNNGTCEECDRSCVAGCTGPSNRLGEGGCNSCAKAVISSAEPALAAYCLRGEEPCPEGFYQEYVGPQAEGPLKSSSGKPVCRKCHHRCRSCTGMGTHTSVCECAKYVAGEQCEDLCPRDYYADELLRRCVKCSAECNGCLGPTEADCISCRAYRIYYAAPEQAQQVAPAGRPPAHRFNCTAKCPAEKPFRISESNMLDPFCSELPDADALKPRPLVPTGAASVCALLLVSSALLMLCFSVYRCQLEQHEKVKLSMHLSGLEDQEPLNPSNMKPNLASLKSIKENELRRGRILGKGVGGVVYQGFWVPECREKLKRRRLAVAIKVLKDNGQANLSKEFLDEAYVMASVDHPNLVKLLAVCVVPKSLMLITQLMPHGCLLDYVRTNRGCISSKRALEWSKQIARGMRYLEERRMVHRDLALRNVLLQSPRKALISDFGLAKFLDNDQNEYQSGLGCVLPIRWLAPECITQRRFTHKSDVWAFGITVWELLTFGEVPYKEYETIEVPRAIVKGARLPHIHGVDLKLFLTLFACWSPEPEGRPEFAHLDEAFTSYAKDPDLFLFCFGGAHKLGCRLSSSAARHPNQDKCASSDDDETFSDEEDVDLEEDDDEEEEDDDEEEAAATARNIAAIPDLTPSTHNRLNEQVFGFELSRSEAAESRPLHQHLQHAHHRHQRLVDDEVFAAPPSGAHRVHRRLAAKSTSEFETDYNNNNNEPATASIMDSEHQFDCWPLQSATSSSNLTHKSEQPTDIYDYLLPSSFALDYENFRQSRHLLSSTSSSGCTASQHQQQAPLSAGLVTNEEYFMGLRGARQSPSGWHTLQGKRRGQLARRPSKSRALEGSAGGLVLEQCARHGDGAGRRPLHQSAALDCVGGRQLSTSTGNIPHSLV